jgi:hypothetical protein
VAGIGTLAWAGLTGPLANDNVTYATVLVNDNQVTNYLQCTGYGFAIPSTATINGITVNVDRKATGTTITDAAMRVVKAGVIGATDRSTATTYTTTDVTEAHGGAATCGATRRRISMRHPWRRSHRPRSVLLAWRQRRSHVDHR